MINPIEQIVTTLEQSKKLAEFWPIDKQTVFVWGKKRTAFGDTYEPIGKVEMEVDNDFYGDFYPAPTLAEVLGVLPDIIETEDNGYEIQMGYSGSVGYVSNVDETVIVPSLPYADYLSNAVYLILDNELVQKNIG